MDKLNRDELFTLALHLDLPSLLTFCKINKKINHDICENGFFWLNKLKRDYPFVDISSVKNYKELYKYLVPRAREYTGGEPRFGDVLSQESLVFNGRAFTIPSDFPTTNPLFWKNFSNIKKQFFWVSNEILQDAKENSKEGISYITGKYNEKYRVKTDKIDDSIKYKTPKLRWVTDHLEPITLQYI